MKMNNADFPLRTEIEIDSPNWLFDYHTPSVFIGSCFSDNIGGILLRNKFPVLPNPFGVLYNPLSISNALQIAISGQPIQKEELIFHGNLWHSFSFHGSFSGSDPETVVADCNTAIAETHRFLKSASYLFISFGTAWAYRHSNSGKIVSNCHKIAANQFERTRLTVDEISTEWTGLLSKLQSFNPGLKAVFTVSPIRHLKDGAHGNQLSKSTLLLAIDTIINNDPTKRTAYFPAYELVNDELRDYRFYNSDMIHMSETTIQFIFEKFKATFFTKEAFEILQQVKSVVQATEHRVLTNDTQSLIQFSRSMVEKTSTLQSTFPYINFQKEIEHFTRLRDLK
jgi:hypothetical protein